MREWTHIADLHPGSRTFPKVRIAVVRGRSIRTFGKVRLVSAFTIVELLVVVSIIALLVAIMLPMLGATRAAARQATCGSNVRQMADATLMYADDNAGSLFPIKTTASDGSWWWFGFEPTGGSMVEGQRELDRTRGRLWPYYEQPDSVEICPSFALNSPHYKPKFRTNWTTYAPPLKLINPTTPARLARIVNPSDTLAFADAAQINAFQAPASPTHPMFEQWHYINATEQQVHYVHKGEANTARFDGHVEPIEPTEAMNTLFAEAPVARPPGSLILDAP